MYSIANLEFQHYPLLLAPMEDVSDPPFRYVCKLFGADVVYSEVISADGLIRDSVKSIKKLDFEEMERPVGIQIFGNAVEPMVEAARYAETAHPDLIDINFGCPVKKVASKGAGSGIMNDIPKMVAITNHSVTDMLTQAWVDSAKLKQTDVFRIPVNDVLVRMLMLRNNEMDAVMVTEPQATEALLFKHKKLKDSRDMGLNMGAIVFKAKTLSDKTRKKQYDVFLKAYNMACDSINQKGVKHYADLIKKYTKADEKVIEALPKLRFEHAAPPRQKDIDAARKWLGK